jgi:hypothetical protein
MKISIKEAYELNAVLSLCVQETELTESQGETILYMSEEMIRMLTASIVTARKNLRLTQQKL